MSGGGVWPVSVSILSILAVVLLHPPEGRLRMSDVSPLSGISGLSFDSTLLSPLLFFCLVSFSLIFFLPAGSKRSMYDYILTYSRLSRENV